MRSWFNNKLITPVGTRGTVYRDTRLTGGIPNNAIDLLESVHLVRGEYRGGVRWYELTHDRFIEPIQNSNAEWWSYQSVGEQNRKRLEQQSLSWLNSNRDPQHLLDEAFTRNAEALIKSGVLDDKKDEALISFVSASRAELERQRAEAKARGQTLAKNGRRACAGYGFSVSVRRGRHHHGRKS